MKKLNLLLIIGAFVLISTTGCKKDKSSDSSTPSYSFKSTIKGSTYSYKQSTFALSTFEEQSLSGYILLGSDGNPVTSLCTMFVIPPSIFKGDGTYTIQDPYQSDPTKLIDGILNYNNSGNFTSISVMSGTIIISDYKAGSFIQGSYSATFFNFPDMGGNVTETGTFYAQAK